VKSTIAGVAAPLAVLVILAALPVPSGLTHQAWYYFALFAAVIVALILEPLPAAAVGLIGVALATVSGLVEPKPADAIRWALAGFSNTTVWLIFASFVFALGYQKTSLGKRIALGLVRLLGGKTLGLGYAVMLADLALAPFTPSNTARSGGIIFPVIRNIPALYGSQPGETARKIGAYLMWTAFAATCVTSSMFLTALGPNLLALDIARRTAQVEISWFAWFAGFLPMGILLVILLPWLVFKLYPPEIRTSREVPEWAGRELATMGKVTRRELTMALLVVMAMALWVFGKDAIDATTVAIVAISLMVVTGVVTWDDILGNKAAWNVLAWFATLVTLADGLNRVGFVTWFAKGAAAALTGLSPVLVMCILVAVFYAIHYLFASLTAHTTALFPVLLAAGVAVPGLPVRTFTLLLGYSLGLIGVLTPYATGPAPVYFGSGYISRRDFWLLGFVFGAIFLVVLLGVGVPYLLALNP
jgi:L-tartrate/succinate antiporter